MPYATPGAQLVLPVGGGDEVDGPGDGVPPVPPQTSNSHSEWPYGVPRVWPFIRTYRAVAVTGTRSTPPDPKVWVYRVVHGPLGPSEVCIWYDDE